MKTIYQRLDGIIPKITDKSFRENKGLGNEISYYIFDYEPKYELLVRDHIQFIKQKISDEYSNIHIKEFDLYEIILETMDKKGYLQKNIEMEKKKGSKYVFNAIRKSLRLTLKNDMVLDYIVNRVEPNDIVFITGVGKAWPIMRSHTVLNNLHNAIDQVPVVMFFPGEYDGLELILFNEIKDDNYYRAFQLIDKY
ncbi:hypothetical protein WX45_01647 [Clostridium ljungdahlii DSM 13528]|uniref:DUF1788 domain-containing protein n=2 Tax=Clostridium ljungdahlii TaxID=1538 RepID=D8GR13_CLOLD|nr:DUF1788 domain-containing protein [Clostridium ljungdahlii]ADK16318.1 conserved hypothetical protein [Clostridium ljungdahlii DSM 13528]OAA89809.1 hypothetical protein WX45_01647 [Clostridium ljungdahlii DSM 13528]